MLCNNAGVWTAASIWESSSADWEWVLGVNLWSVIHGVRVLGGATELPLAVSANRIQAVFVCMSDLTDTAAREVVDVCERAGVEYRIVPALSDLLSADAFSSERANVSTGSVAVARQ